MTQVRVLRLLEYTGDLKEIKEHLNRRGVQGTKRLSDHGPSTIVITEHFLGNCTSVWDELNLTARIVLGDIND